MFEWCLFVSHLPSGQRTPRMRLWRGLRGLGAAILRDGVYLLPRRTELGTALREHAQAVREAGGSAHVLVCSAEDAAEEGAFRALFDRREAYAGWHEDAAALQDRLPGLAEGGARREEAALRRALEDILGTDFFPDGTGEAALAAMAAVTASVDARFSPDEPVAREGTVARREVADFQGRTWATRRGLWIDRVASAWLIRRRIDPQARFLWLASPTECPADAVGFDFDGAEFSHVGERVTFEVLAAAFGLEAGPLARLGALVRYLDLGGPPIAEAPGLVALLGAARDRCADDDAFLEAASALLDDLLAAFAAPRKPA